MAAGRYAVVLSQDRLSFLAAWLLRTKHSLLNAHMGYEQEGRVQFLGGLSNAKHGIHIPLPYLKSRGVCPKCLYGLGHEERTAEKSIR